MYPDVVFDPRLSAMSSTLLSKDFLSRAKKQMKTLPLYVLLPTPFWLHDTHLENFDGEQSLSLAFRENAHCLELWIWNLSLDIRIFFLVYLLGS